MKTNHFWALLAAWALCIGCQSDEAASAPSAKAQTIADMKRATDNHSFSRPQEAVTTNLSWTAKVDFDTRQISATAQYQIATADDAQRILLDCRGLDIASVMVRWIRLD